MLPIPALLASYFHINKINALILRSLLHLQLQRDLLEVAEPDPSSRLDTLALPSSLPRPGEEGGAHDWA